MKQIKTKSELQSEISGKKCVVIFGADWCIPCSKLKDIIFALENNEDVENQINGYTMLYVDVSDCDNELISYFAIRGIPVTIIFDDSENVTNQIVGAMSRDNFMGVLI